MSANGKVFELVFTADGIFFAGGSYKGPIRKLDPICLRKFLRSYKSRQQDRVFPSTFHY